MSEILYAALMVFTVIAVLSAIAVLCIYGAVIASGCGAELPREDAQILFEDSIRKIQRERFFLWKSELKRRAETYKNRHRFTSNS